MNSVTWYHLQLLGQQKTHIFQWSLWGWFQVWIFVTTGIRANINLSFLQLHNFVSAISLVFLAAVLRVFSCFFSLEPRGLLAQWSNVWWWKIQLGLCQCQAHCRVSSCLTLCGMTAFVAMLYYSLESSVIVVHATFYKIPTINCRKTNNSQSFQMRLVSPPHLPIYNVH